MVKIETTNNNKKREGCVTWDCWLCDSKFNNKSKLRKHLFDHFDYNLHSNHDIRVNWFYCDQDGCNYKSKNSGHLKRHKASIHNIGVTWFHCDQVGCNYKSKRKDDLKTHKSCIHDIDVTWFHCDQDGCKYKCKQKSSLKTHKRRNHQNNLFQTEIKIEAN